MNKDQWEAHIYIMQEILHETLKNGGMNDEEAAKGAVTRLCAILGYEEAPRCIQIQFERYEMEGA